MSQSMISNMKKKPLAFLIALAFIGSSLSTPAFAAVKAGAKCKIVGQTKVKKGKEFICIAKGKKLVWSKGLKVVVKATPTPSSTPTPTPTVVNLTFDNLYENRADISYSVWKKTSDLIKESSTKAGQISIFTGPNTKTYFDDYSYAISQVSKMFPNKPEAKEVLVIRYIYKDLDWAEDIAITKLSSNDYNQIIRSENGSVTKSNCDSKTQNCRGSKQITPASGIAVILQGVDEQITRDNSGSIRFTSGMLEAHEYFHSLQRIPIMNTGVQVWPHAWWREGSAEWVQNMSISFQNFPQYKKFIVDDCSGSCKNMTALQIEEFLNTADGNFLPSKFDSWLNYSLGSHVVELLVAIKGPDVLINMYEEMGKGLKFDDAFNKIFGLGWKESIPILAKTIHANSQG